MSFTPVKATFNGETRRFKLCAEQLTASELTKEFNRVFEKDPATVLTLQYKDSDDDLITITSDEELSEAVRLSETSGVLRLFAELKNSSAANNNNAEQQPAGGDNQCDTCPISRFFKVHRRGCGEAREGGGRRCCPGKIIKGAIFAIIAFRILSFFAHHFLCLALLALPFIAIRALKRRFANRARQWAAFHHGRVPPHAAGFPGAPAPAPAPAPVPGACPFARGPHHARFAVPHPVPAAVPIPVPVPAAENVVPVAAPAFVSYPPFEQVAEENNRDGNNDAGASRFQSLLEQLRAMGFHDRTQNIDALVRSNLELARAVEHLLQ